MSNERLSSLTLHMQPVVPIDIEEVINEFSRHHPSNFMNLTILGQLFC